VQAACTRRRCDACFAETSPRRIFALCVLLSTLLAASLVAAQANQADARLNPPALTAPGSAATAATSLTCQVRNLLGRPLSGISVEVRNIQTHSTITRSLSGPNGAVVFRDLLPGRYEITIAGGLLPPRREMQVDSGDSHAVLELPISQLKAGETVSVRQLTVPRKAQEALEAASDALQKQNWTKARAQATRALTLHPDYAAALSLLGYLDLQDGNPEMASVDVKRAIESDPNSALAYLTLGSAYNSLKRYEAALEALSVFPSVSADTWQLHYEAARSYMGLRKFELGLIEISLAQKLAPQDPAVLILGKAHALAGLHRNSEAIAELETLLRKQPKGPFASDAQSFLAILRAQKQH
jgi:Tetratricopeptide repeat